MAGFQVTWRGMRFDLDWGQVATQTRDELRISQPDGGAWIVRDVPGRGLQVVYHAAPPDPLLNPPIPERPPAPWQPHRSRPKDENPDEGPDAAQG